MKTSENYLNNIRKLFRFYKQLGTGALAQIPENKIHYSPHEESLSTALIVKHISGNMLSRFTNFLTEDGEKPWRNRETEFEDTVKDKVHLLEIWEKGWSCLLGELDALEPNHLQQLVLIRNEKHTVLEALNRQLGHYSYHIGQIVYLGKMIQGNQWNSLSIPKGKSEEFNMKMFGTGE